MSTRAQHGSLQRRKRAGVWKWLGLWRADGQRKAKTLGLCTKMTKAEAEDEFQKILQPLNAAKGATEHTLQTYARMVVFPWYRRSWKPSTAMTTVDRIDHHILNALGNQTLSSFTRDQLQNFLDEKATTRPARGDAGTVLSTSTVGHLRWDLRQLFRMAVNDGLLARNPAELLHAPTKQRRARRVLTLGELRTILGALPVRDKLIISLAGVSGLRPGEILAIRWGDLREDGIHIERAIYRGTIQTPKTHHSVRTAAISDTITNDIDTWRNLSPNTNAQDWMFPNERGNKPLAHGNYWRNAIKPILEELKLTGITFQALRRTAVTLLNEHGADATIVAAQCGHTVDVSTNVYNKVSINRQAAAINKLDNALHQEPTRAGQPSEASTVPSRTATAKMKA